MTRVPCPASGCKAVVRRLGKHINQKHAGNAALQAEANRRIQVADRPWMHVVRGG